MIYFMMFVLGAYWMFSAAMAGGSRSNLTTILWGASATIPMWWMAFR